MTTTHHLTPMKINFLAAHHHGVAALREVVLE